MYPKSGHDLHSSLKTDIIDSTQVQGLKLVRVRLQWSKEDVAFSVHVSPNQYSTSGMQLTDALSHLGFSRQPCPFLERQEGYCDWVDENEDLSNLAAVISAVHSHLQDAQQRLQACGLGLPQPEGYGYFFGKNSGERHRVHPTMFGDGHTSPKTEVMKASEDDAFKFVFTWIQGAQTRAGLPITGRSVSLSLLRFRPPSTSWVWHDSVTVLNLTSNLVTGRLDPSSRAAMILRGTAMRSWLTEPLDHWLRTSLPAFSTFWKHRRKRKRSAGAFSRCPPLPRFVRLEKSNEQQ